RLVAYQIGAAQALARYAGHRLSYVKAHGALGNMMEADASLATAVARAVKAVDPSLMFLAIACSEQVKAGKAAGLTTVAEIYADRGYTEEGRLVPRGKPGAMIEDPDEAADRVLAMVEAGAIFTVAGTRLPTDIGSVCVHGDSPHAVETARRVRARLEAAGVKLAPFALQ